MLKAVRAGKHDQMMKLVCKLENWSLAEGKAPGQAHMWAVETETDKFIRSISI